jgi:hypothetical protein
MKELPPGWLSRVRIKWVREGKEETFRDGDVILRLHPLANQDANLTSGIYYAFQMALFPNVHEVIPVPPRRAAALQLSRRAILRNHPYALVELERRYIEPAIENDPETAYYLGHYETLDQRGFFTSVFIRELSELAERVRHTEGRLRIGDDLKSILEHMLLFTKAHTAIPDDLWFKSSEAYSYAFLLVARPYSRSTQAYGRRANAHAQNGVTRLYLLGASQERSFVKGVIKHISTSTRYALTEIIPTNRDYRAEDGGICAVFDLSKTRRQAEQAISEFFQD